MHVKPVADDLRGDFVGLQDRAGQARAPVIDRRHPVEQMGRVTCAGGNRGHSFVVCRTGMPERHAMTAGRERSNQVERALELRREGDDSDVRRGTLDLGDDSDCVEVRSLGWSLAIHRGLALHGGRALNGAGARAFRLRRRLRWTAVALVNAVRRAQTRQRLRAPVFRVDEIAFEMRRQHARGPWRRRFAGAPHLIEHAAQRLGSAGDGRRTERRHAVLRKSFGNRRDRTSRCGGIQRVDSLDAVNVDVDEAGHDVMSVEREQRMRVAGRRRVGADLDDPIAVDDERARRQDAVRQHQRRA